MKRIYCILMIVTLVLTGLSSCMRDDLSKCPATRIIVKFDPEMFDLPENEHLIGRVHVYAFNQDNIFVSSWQGGAYDYLSGQPYIAELELEPGGYRLLAWTNFGEPFKTTPALSEWVPYQTTLNEIEMFLDEASGNRYTEDIPDLHYGYLLNANVSNTDAREHVIHLIPDTYRIHVTVRGLHFYEDEFEFEIKDNNTHFSFENRILNGYTDCYHVRSARHADDRISGSLRVLSLTNDHALENIGRVEKEDRAPQFTFTDLTTETTLHTDNLVRMIRKAYETSGQTVDFDKTYHYSIILTFDDKLNVTVSVNGWSYTYNPTEL